jgi:hypothetical protein
LTANGKQTGPEVTFDVVAKPDSPDLQFVWEVQDAAPSMGNGKTFKTTFPNSPDRLVKVTAIVTAFTKDGCSATQSVSINIG